MSRVYVCVCATILLSFIAFANQSVAIKRFMYMDFTTTR